MINYLILKGKNVAQILIGASKAAPLAGSGRGYTIRPQTYPQLLWIP
jgi:hypothetical protein